VVDKLEIQFDAMSVDVKAAWIAFWELLETVDWRDDQDSAIRWPFHAATLLSALEALDGDRRADAIARLIRSAKITPDGNVWIQRGRQ